MIELLVMRLSDMKVVHPDQILRKCASCGYVVAVYPSGQRVLKEHPDTVLICSVCKTPGKDTHLAPGAEIEPFQSVKKQ